MVKIINSSWNENRSSAIVIECNNIAGPSEAGRLGRPEPPHFPWKKIIIIARVRSLLSGATSRIEACAWCRVCTCNKLNLRAAGLCEFSSTVVLLSDRDVFVSTSSIRDW